MKPTARPPHPRRRAPAGPVIVVVMDGVGIGSGGPEDAVALARTPHLDALRALPSTTALAAHGRAVGMPSDGDMGNSEVGHNALGAGRVFEQGAALVANAIESGGVFDGEVWKQDVARVERSGEPLHFLGLLSDGNVHAHIDHLLAMLRRAADDGVSSLRVHALLDGRDVDARSALVYAEQLETELAALRARGVDAQVASGGGRMRITMDRYEADWAMVQRGWETHVKGVGRVFPDLRTAVETLYAESEVGDQDLDPFVIADQDGPVGPIRDGAAVVLFNFRGDRAIEISRAFDEAEFDAFDRGPRPDASFAGMMQYDGDLGIPRRFLVDPPAIDRPMGAYLAASGVRQLAISETQKFGHVTYFWNGNRSGKFDEALERYIEIPSDLRPVAQRPWMKSAEITDALVDELRSAADAGEGYGLVRVNYANGDMVGHTGDLAATSLAMEAVDVALGRLRALTDELGGVLVVTADHGNADHMFESGADGRRTRTSHSLNPVPLIIYDPREPTGGPRLASGPGVGLANVAATVFELLGLSPPEDYAPSLLDATQA